MNKKREKPLYEYALLALGALICLIGTALGPESLLWLGSAVLTADGLLWARQVKRLNEEAETQARQAERERFQAVLRENELREAGQEALESYRSTLAHGLRMPIAVIQGYADLLRGGMVEDEDTRRDYLDKISQRSQYMAELLARRRTGDTSVDEKRLELENQDLITLIRDICMDTKSYAATHGIVIQVLHSVTRLAVPLDKYLISRVLYNLLENSVKYMGRPGTVTVRVWPQQEWAVLDIQDDGLGLPSEEVEHIFDLHFQGSNRVNGQGHGLYLVKKAVEAHHGMIKARSAPGRGLGLRIYLPLEVQESTGSKPAAEKEEA